MQFTKMWSLHKKSPKFRQWATQAGDALNYIKWALVTSH